MLKKKAVLPRIPRKRVKPVTRVPKTNPKQQRHLKRRFMTAPRRGHNKNLAAQSPLPPSQRVWRRTAVRTKPKPKVKLPRLFRLDRLTGLPVDYEKTVERVMHYVNPHLDHRPNPEQMLEDMLTNMFAEAVRQGCRNHPQVFSHLGAHQLRALLKDSKGCTCPMGKYLNKSDMNAQSEKDRRETNESLQHFHSACKRGPRSPHSTRPTYTSKFNFNQLRIKST
ncbi:uncharacterized protein Dana_GF15017 [Drosophila ananassae]|uniref:Uncharacterized protein n=1 Tax=Drosophila ananassae TaxID=7217 RepID=B3MLN8_DROAN|nr:uncharacterized protein LOC6497832 [Drosophila ananassae]EDV30759.1 uncharacterized protein Dana_GF15017 [Drosophila ananassae]